jgi:hypothetical protein
VDLMYQQPDQALTYKYLEPESESAMPTDESTRIGNRL